MKSVNWKKKHPKRAPSPKFTLAGRKHCHVTLRQAQGCWQLLCQMRRPRPSSLTSGRQTRGAVLGFVLPENLNPITWSSKVFLSEAKISIATEPIEFTCLDKLSHSSCDGFRPIYVQIRSWDVFLAPLCLLEYIAPRGNGLSR